jgi:CheY-like chemotaxis protein
MPPSGAPLRVLVVEDDHLVRTFIRFALERDGMEPTECADGIEALAQLAARPFDAVLSDGLLPDMHGIALADSILDNPSTAATPICFLSGAVPSRIPTVAGVACLSKPVRPQHLTEQLRGLVAWRDAGGSPVEERRAALRKLESGFLVGP